MVGPSADEHKALRLLVGGPGLCLVCGRTFTRGGAFDTPRLLESPAVCMWCIAAWLGEMTGWAIVDQMRGWLVARGSGRPSQWEAIEDLDAYDHDPGCDDYP